LAEEINNLILSQHRAIEKALHMSGNLAHGLKTPLAAISALCHKINSPEHVKDVDSISHYIADMHLHVERQLAIARSQAEAVSFVGDSKVIDEIEDVIKTLNKINDGKNINWNLEIDHNLRINIQRNDFAEIMGNLLDNARKWAVSHVNVAASETDTHLRIFISDDGPGVDLRDHKRILERGIRLDERTPGTGLGLSICQAILETYQSSLELVKSETGGLTIYFEISKSASR
jgi:signal transduction histidine kinase